MKQPIDDGGPVYPHLVESCQLINESELYPGMTLRAWFAGLAMQGILSGGLELAKKTTGEKQTVTQAAIGIADSMIAALKEKNDSPT